MDKSIVLTGQVQKKAGYHHGNLRHAILEAVALLIEQRRSLEFQLKEIAGMAGTSPAAIYKHFDSKQALLVDAAIVGYEIQKSFRDEAMDEAGDSPLKKLLAIGRAYIAFGKAHPGYFLLMKTLETEDILSSERYQTQRLETLALIRRLVLDCIASGLFVDMDPDLAMASLQAGAFGIAHLYVSDQLQYVAPALEADENLAERILLINLGRLLSAEGDRQLRSVSEDPLN